MSEPSQSAFEPQEQGLMLSPSKLIPWLRRAPLLPEAGAAGKPLIIVIAVICFLASLSLASLQLVDTPFQVFLAEYLLLLQSGR